MCTDVSLQDEVYFRMNLGVQFKLHEVHFSDKFSRAKLARQRRTCLQSACTECSFNPNVNEEVAKYLKAELARRGVLGYLIFNFLAALSSSRSLVVTVLHCNLKNLKS